MPEPFLYFLNFSTGTKSGGHNLSISLLLGLEYKCFFDN